MATIWYTYNGHPLNSGHGVCGKTIIPPQPLTFRFQFGYKDVGYDPSSLIPDSNSCAESYTWSNVSANLWDCTVTRKSSVSNSSAEGLFRNVFTRSNIPYSSNVYDIYLTQVPDTSAITNMSHMFDTAEILMGSAPLMDTSNVTDMSYMFYGSRFSSFPAFNTSKVTDMSYMFASGGGFTLQLMDTGKVTNMSHMFDRARPTGSIPQFDTSNVVDMSYMFKEVTLSNVSGHITTIPQFNTSKVTNMSYMFANNSGFTSIPLLDTGKVTDMSHMFYKCEGLTSVPQFDTSKAVDMSYMFAGAMDITTIPTLNAASATNIERMFAASSDWHTDAPKITTVPLSNTGNVQEMYSLCSKCSTLTTIPLLATESVTSSSFAFYECTNVAGGALTLYQQMSTQANPPSSHQNMFLNCGSNTTTGAAELAQIPSSWGGTGA